MAWGFVQGKGANAVTQTTISVTLTNPVSSGSAVLGAFGFSAATSVTKVQDDKGNLYNLETAIGDGGTGLYCAFSLTNITNAPQTITATVVGGAGFIQIVADEFSGGSTASSDERDGAAHGGQNQPSPGTGTDAITSGLFATATDGDLIYGNTIGFNATAQTTHGTNFSDATLFNVNFPQASEFLVQNSHASIATTFTQSVNGAKCTFLIALKAPGGVGPTPPLEFDNPGAHIIKKVTAIAY